MVKNMCALVLWRKVKSKDVDHEFVQALFTRITYSYNIVMGYLTYFTYLGQSRIYIYNTTIVK